MYSPFCANAKPLVFTARSLQASVAMPGTLCDIAASRQSLSADANVNSARLILVCLLLAVPVILLLDGPIVQGIVAAVLAAGLLLIGATIRQGETEFLLAAIRPAVALALIPLFWIVVQILPLEAIGLAHPIWQSAEQALEHPLRGSISIDPGATILALAQYLSELAAVVLAAAVAVDRTRAEWVLFALMAATALVALLMIAHDLTGFALLRHNGVSVASARVCAALGTIVSTAAAIRTIERYETGRLRPGRGKAIPSGTFAACAVALALCLIALALEYRSSTWFGVAYGLCTLLVAVAIRRIGLGLWGSAAVAVVAIVIGIGFIVSEPAIRSSDLTLAFAVDKADPLLSTTQRILADAPWTGTGAGTFAAIMPIYREAGEFIVNPTPPTAAAKVAIELGRLMLWLIIVIVVIAIFVLLRGALARGRDSFYPAAGASSLILLLLSSFCEPGTLSLAAGLCAAAVLGLSFAQRISRSIP
jgi:hypothetical protein